jgi:hypothetical protein
MMKLATGTWFAPATYLTTRLLRRTSAKRYKNALNVKNTGRIGSSRWAPHRRYGVAAS